ncbi:aminopeptidase P family protein [Corynebacterium lizhenjunii]|uniref:Aminopeptidase P family protein n=1 Tax=Corynebacterium lizhenjunii TaxID=2709394 RepID=A0A7T0KGD6_9CORY|nr:Xaa-Pro peptidase family protein [Corynebacterium lizhenjunii]QPK80318.1 aminopeptidase P family protein [Corynebacterium lizhenjunii]
MTLLESKFPAEVYAQRLAQAKGLAADSALDAVVVGTGAEFAYLTGSWVSSHERLTALVIPADGDPFIVAPQTDVADLADAPVAELELAIVAWRDGQDPYATVAEGIGEGSGGAAVWAVTGELRADHLLRLQEHTSARFVLANTVLAALFSVKDPEEIAQLEAAARAIDRVHAGVPELLVPGATEAQVAEVLHQRILEEHDSVDFVIVGSGPNGANPHHSFSGRALELGDPVVVDLGGTLGAGYHSDCTRTYVVGGPEAASEEFVQAYEVLERAQKAARELAGPGRSAGTVDEAAREVLREAGYGEEFFHRTGHGIGLSVHEEPFIVGGNQLQLLENMAFSIEPGIYRAGHWGMRLEDIVVTTPEGIRSLNQVERGLR